MNRTSISDLKAKAKDQLLGNYGIATGSFALLFVLMYSIMSIVISAFATGFYGNDPTVIDTSLARQLGVQFVGILIGSVCVTFSVGYIYMLRRITKGERPELRDMFFAFRNHPDKVIILSLILSGIQFILLIPANIIGIGSNNGVLDGKRFLLFVVLYLAGLIISLVIDLMLAMCFLIYIDDPQMSVAEIVKGSVNMMRGNKFRYFYLGLTFIGYWLLAILSLFVAALWIAPYQTMTMIDFYLDIRKDYENGI